MIKAVLWDFGGVITSSPFEAFNRYELSNDIPRDFIRSVNATNPDSNAWAKFESSLEEGSRGIIEKKAEDMTLQKIKQSPPNESIKSLIADGRAGEIKERQPIVFKFIFRACYKRALAELAGIPSFEKWKEQK